MNSQLKIAFATYDTDSDVGGVSSWLQRLLPRLQGAGFNVEAHVISDGGRPGVNCASLTRLGVPFRLASGEADTLKGVRNCLKLIEAGQPDIYVPNCIVPAYFAASYMRRQGGHTVGVLHSDDPYYWGIVDEFVNGPAAFRLSAVVAVSAFLQAAVAGPSAKAGMIVRRIGCGVPITKELARRPDGVFRLVYTGRLEEKQKCISEVTRAFCSVARQNPAVEAWIVGEGTARASIEQIIRASGLQEGRVKLVGRVELPKIYQVLSQCHAFVLLSDFEGLPVSMLEAMAAGVVPVCLDMRSGIREAVQSGVNGLIVKDREADFRAAIQTLSENPGLWSEMSANARETVKQKFSDEICIESWVELIRSLGKRKGEKSIKTPSFIRLPPRNLKFGIYDQRISTFSRVTNPVRGALGRCRRKLMKAVQPSVRIRS